MEQVGREAGRALVAQSAVRPAGVELLAEVLEHDAGFGRGQELFAVEAFIGE